MNCEPLPKARESGLFTGVYELSSAVVSLYVEISRYQAPRCQRLHSKY